MKRADAKYKWDLSPLFKSDTDPKIKKERYILQKKAYSFISKWKDRIDYLEDPKVLKEALDEYENWVHYFGAEGDQGYYFGLRNAQDENNPDIKASLNSITSFATKIENDIQFFGIRIAKIPPKKQKEILAYKPLKPYRHFLEKSFEEAKYLLSEPEEKIMNIKAPTSHSNWVRMTSSLLAKEEKEILDTSHKHKTKNFSEIISLIDNTDKKVRDSAAKAFNEILEKYSDVAENELNSILYNKKNDDELRKMPRPDLGRHISDDIESGIVDTLVEQTAKKYDISKRYYTLKAKLLGLKQLEYHERNIPYGKLDLEYSYSKTVSIVSNTLEDVDEDFSDVFKSLVKKGQIDVFPQHGKTSGAFCAGGRLDQPTYILLNFAGKFNDVTTIAHETGHAINNELMRKTQNALNFGAPLSIAEVASTFTEDFVLNRMTEKADDETKLAIMMMRLNDSVSTIIRQIACYRFEQELHKTFREKEYLSKKEIGKLFQKHMSAYMGRSVKLSKGSQNWWIYWGHIRRFFYNYSYASGLLISKAMQNMYKENPASIRDIKELLSAGTSDSPKNIFKKLGIDISKPQFWQKGLEEIDQLLKETQKLAIKMKKIQDSTLL